MSAAREERERVTSDPLYHLLCDAWEPYSGRKELWGGWAQMARSAGVIGSDAWRTDAWVGAIKEQMVPQAQKDPSIRTKLLLLFG